MIPLCLFYRRGKDIAFLLLYVDDIVLTASFESLRQNIVSLLSSEFAMKDLSLLLYILGIKVTRTTDDLFLSQDKYATNIIERAGMSSCKPSHSPVDTACKLEASSSSPVFDVTLYRSLARALQYLTFTRPDISYVVQQICLHMHDPREHHFHALKRIIRYVQGIKQLGLHLNATSTSSLVCYTDAIGLVYLILDGPRLDIVCILVIT